MFYTEKELSSIEETISSHIPTVRQLDQEVSLYNMELCRATVAKLRGESEKQGFPESSDMPESLQKNRIAALSFHLYALVRDCLFGDHARAVDRAAVCESFLDGGRRDASVPVFHFCKSLAFLAAVSSGCRIDRRARTQGDSGKPEKDEEVGRIRPGPNRSFVFPCRTADG